MNDERGAPASETSPASRGSESRAPKARTPVLAFVLGTTVALCGGGLLVAVALSDTLVTSRAREALVERGVVCDERFAVDVNWSFSEATLAPTRCTLVRVSFADAVELPEGATASLSGLSPSELRIPAARVFLVDASSAPIDLGPMGALGTLGLGSIAGVGSRVASTGQATAEIAAHQPVPTTITRLELVHRGEVEVAITELAIGGGVPTTFRAARAELSELSGPMGIAATASLSDLTGTATASTCHLEGELTIGARMPIVGMLSHETHVVLEGAALDGPDPTFSVSAGSASASD
jgi:hypothetical protein